MHQIYETSYTTTEDHGYALMVNGREHHRCRTVALLFDAGCDKVLSHGDAERVLALHQSLQREALHLDPSGDRADELVWIEAPHVPAHELTGAINGDLDVVYMLWRRHRYAALLRTDAVLRELTGLV